MQEKRTRQLVSFLLCLVLLFSFVWGSFRGMVHPDDMERVSFVSCSGR